jgi:hypothetical protein
MAVGVVGMTVADYLGASLQAHARYREAAAKQDVAGKRWALKEAQTHRLEAERLDPEHTDPAWALDKVPSRTMLDFYAEQVGA